METKNANIVTIEALVYKPIEKIWECWTKPEHIKIWNTASDDWHTTNSENDLKVGGKFLTKMEAKDKSFGFDFWGVYDEVKINELISFTLGDNRKVKILFIKTDMGIKIVETFETEAENPIEMQKDGWQAILNNFKKYTESHS